MTSPATPEADVAVIGGSGFYSFLDDPEERRRRHAVRRALGAGLGRRRSRGRRVAFLPRHGRRHEFPPHRINYRANLWALRSLGVRQVLAPCAVGGLRDEVAPGDLVVPDQLVDRTSGRERAVRRERRGAPAVRRPLLPAAVAAVAGAGRRRTARRHHGGHRRPALLHPRRVAATTPPQGWTLINMTGAPEAALARELRHVLRRRSRWSPTWTPAPRPAQGVGQEEVFALFARQHRAAQGAARRRRSPTCPTPTAAPATPGPTASTLTYEIP